MSATKTTVKLICKRCETPYQLFGYDDAQIDCDKCSGEVLGLLYCGYCDIWVSENDEDEESRQLLIALKKCQHDWEHGWNESQTCRSCSVYANDLSLRPKCHCGQGKVNRSIRKAIQLLKAHGYTVTKQDL